ncbi:MAG: signal peptidase II [Maribacter sp.]|jgi:signal peptidase II
MKNKLFRNIFILAIVILNIGCDQATKNIAREQINYNEQKHIIGDNFIITKVENTGAFLGMGDDLPKIYWNIFMLGMPILLLVVLLAYLLFKNDFDNLSIVGLSFIIGGGLGNMIDRYLYNSVTDFLFIDVGVAQTGIFNMADVSVMIGSGLVMVQYIRTWKKPGVQVE